MRLQKWQERPLLRRQPALREANIDQAAYYGRYSTCCDRPNRNLKPINSRVRVECRDRKQHPQKDNTEAECEDRVSR